MKIYKLSYKIPPGYASIFLAGTNRKLEYIPLEKVRFEPWNEERTHKHLDRFKKGLETDPVFVQPDSNENPSRYYVLDGNHRCEASRIMGYGFIPAVIIPRP